jgi:GMP synthase-like glutamine amidotransferase
MTLNAWHQDQVVARPPGAKVIATSPFCENAALLYGDRILTVQAHPEIDNAYLAGLIREKGPGVVPDLQLATAAARIGTPLQDQAMADRIAAFFRQPRKGEP